MDYSDALAKTGKAFSALDNLWTDMSWEAKIGWYVVVIVIIVLSFKVAKGGKE